MKLTTILALLVSLTLLFGGGYFAFATDGGTTYLYDVKSEQVESDAATINETVPLDDLDRAQQDAIFKAWKQSDHFLGSSSATIETDESLDLTRDERWQAVEIEGVSILVGIHGPDTRTNVTGISALGVILSTIGFMGTVSTLIEVAEP